MSTRVVVVGAGVAGLSAALRLAARGCTVTVLESRPRLGGRACSFERGALTADNGQHVILRCYRRYRALLATLGVAHLVPLQDRLDVPVAYGDGRSTRLRRGRSGPAPAHLLPALAGYRALTVRERLLAVRAAAALRTVDPLDPTADQETFGSWLARHGQTDRTRRLLWDLVTVPALNLAADHASLALAARVFRTGLLDDVAAGDIGVPRAPLAALHDAPARAAFTRLGITLRTGARAAHIVHEGGGFTVTGRERAAGAPFSLAADQVVLAVPHEQAARLVPPAAAPDADRWEALGASAILNTHLLLDRRVLAVPFLAAPDSAAQWVFDRSSGIHAGDGRGQYLVTSVSAASEDARRPAREVLRVQLAAVSRLLPAIRSARVVDAFVTREPRATFCQRAGTARLRPPATTRLPGLVLAGAWTATGWPDTLEGAVRSGEAAADALLGAPARPTTRREQVAA